MLRPVLPIISQMFGYTVGVILSYLAMVSFCLSFNDCPAVLLKNLFEETVYDLHLECVQSRLLFHGRGWTLLEFYKNFECFISKPNPHGFSAGPWTKNCGGDYNVFHETYIIRVSL